jgi:hypothetical protein
VSESNKREMEWKDIVFRSLSREFAVDHSAIIIDLLTKVFVAIFFFYLWGIANKQAKH